MATVQNEASGSSNGFLFLSQYSLRRIHLTWASSISERKFLANVLMYTALRAKIGSCERERERGLLVRVRTVREGRVHTFVSTRSSRRGACMRIYQPECAWVGGAHEGDDEHVLFMTRIGLCSNPWSSFVGVVDNPTLCIIYKDFREKKKKK
jgi:hypothetical protein